MSGSGYRPLLPATEPHSPPAIESSSKRKRVAVACSTCRTKRIACDGRKPCTACERSRLQCIYLNVDSTRTLREKLAAFQEIMEHLQDRPNHVTQGVLQRLGKGSNPIAVLKTLKGEMPEAVLSEQDTARAILPTILSSCEFELLVRYPNAYHTVDLAAYTRSIHGTVRSSPFHTASVKSGNALELDSNNIIGPLEDGAEYYDARLAQLDIRFWTHVPITNAQAAGAISLYLETQLPTWGLFDPALFVRDLVEGRFEYCSPFMVASLLALALQTYTLLPTHLLTESRVFREEAAKLFVAQGDSEMPPNIAGCALLYMTFAMDGDVHTGLPYLKAAVKSAEKMKLYEEPSSADLVLLQTLTTLSRTAWGVFNMHVVASQFHLLPPLKRSPATSFLTNPDTVDLDVNPRPQNRDISGETLGSPSSDDADKLLWSMCQLRAIFNQVFLVYRDEKDQSGSLAFALSKYHQVLQLADKLPASANRQGQGSSSSLFFHITLHMAVLDIFRRFVVKEKQYSFGSYQPHGASPTTIFAASVQQLKGLLYEYATKYPPHHWQYAISGAIIYTVNAISGNELDPDRRTHVLFYINMLQQMLQSYGLMKKTMQALMMTVMDKGVLTSAEALAIVQNTKGIERVVKEGSDRGGWVVDVGLAMDNITAADANTLASRFETIALFDEFVEDLG